MTERQDEPLLNADAILQQIDALRLPREAESVVAMSRAAYRQAAAVLAAINDVEALRPVGGEATHGLAASVLADDLVPAPPGQLAGRFMLQHDVRRAALRELNTVERMQRAVTVNNGERTGRVQQQFEAYLKGTAVPIDEQLPAELEATLQALVWLDGLIPGLPALDRVRGAIRRRDFLAPFETLAGDDIFRGRVAELDRLREHVGVLAPERLLAQLRRAVSWLRPTSRPALSVSGPGGVGKSALIARFVLEHSRLPHGVRLPFAYLDFDRPILNIAEPATLLVEMAHQLTFQFPDDVAIGQLRDRIVEAGAHAKDVERGFTDVVRTLKECVGERPYLIVVDTFEHVQYRGESQAFSLWKLLDRVQREYPFLRVVVSGRAPVTSLQLAGGPPELLEVGHLDQKSAIAFVEAQGVPAGDAHALVVQVGGVPLSLKLAATLFRKQSTRDLQLKAGFWMRVADEVVQGQLYDRILDRIDDPEVARIAHPGLVLRRITPDVILNVLKEPCLLTVKDREDATVLFDKLRRHTSLVSVDDAEGALVHRRDLRAVMLTLLRQRNPAQVKDISERAATWYASEPGTRARTEAAYYRLLNDQYVSVETLEHPDTRLSIQAYIAEFPLSVQRRLATLGFQVHPEILAKAGTDEREAVTAAQIEQLLPHGPDGAERGRQLLAQSPEAEQDSPLWRARARVYLESGDPAKAFDAIEAGLRYAVQAGSTERLLQLSCDKAWICESAGRTGELADALATLAEQVARHDDDCGHLQWWLQSQRQRPEWHALTLDGAAATDLEAVFKRLTSRQLFGLMPVMAGFWPVVGRSARFEFDPAVELLRSSYSFFEMTSFFAEDAAVALRRVLRVAYEWGRSAREHEGFRRDLGETLDALVQVWPYRNIHVYPAEVHHAYASA